jgi:heptosyltransferase-2
MSVRQEEILIVRLAGLGDIATATTMLSRIRAERPTARVTWMCGSGGAPLVGLFDGVHEVIEVDEARLFRGSAAQQAVAVARAWSRLMRRRYDVALVAHVDQRYRWLVRPIPSTRVRMLDRSGQGRRNPIPGRFFGDEFARLLDPPDADGYRPGRYSLLDLRQRVATVELPEDVRRLLADRRLDVLLVPGGARNILRDDPLRRWPTAGYADVARQLIAAGLSVAVIGSADDAWVRPAFADVPVVDLIGRLSIPQTLRVIAESGVLVSHDTGPIHFARLVRTHLVALFGPTIPREVLGESDQVTVLWGGAHLACRPCYDGRNFAPCPRNVCLEDVTAASVVAATRAALTALSTPPP